MGLQQNNRRLNKILKSRCGGLKKLESVVKLLLNNVMGSYAMVKRYKTKKSLQNQQYFYVKLWWVYSSKSVAVLS